MRLPPERFATTALASKTVINVTGASTVSSPGPTPLDITYPLSATSTPHDVAGGRVLSPPASHAAERRLRPGALVDFDGRNYKTASKTVYIPATSSRAIRRRWATPADIMYGTALGGGALNAAANGIHVHSRAGTALNPGARPLGVDFHADGHRQLQHGDQDRVHQVLLYLHRVPGARRQSADAQCWHPGQYPVSGSSRTATETHQRSGLVRVVCGHPALAAVASVCSERPARYDDYRHGFLFSVTCHRQPVHL